MHYVNGQLVPDDLSISEAAVMLESNDMQSFAVACEVLTEKRTTEAYQILKRYLDTKDIYKYRYILSVIFAFDQSVELSDYFISALQSDNRWFVTAAMGHLIHRNLWVSDDQVLSCFEKNQSWIDSYYLQILTKIEKTSHHAERIIKLFNSSSSNSARIAIAECLVSFAMQDNYLKLFNMLSNSDIPKLRLCACRIASIFGRGDLLLPFKEDPDGHIRKFVNRALNL